MTGSTLNPIVLLLAMTLAGCSMHQVKDKPAPLSPAPKAFAGKGGTAKAPLRWWTAFGDRQLDGLMTRALAGNMDLKRAAARLGMAGALAAQQSAAQWPQVSIEAGVNASKNNIFLKLPGQEGRQLEVTTTTVPLMLTAAYEVDLWGRVSSVRKAAGLDLAATREDRDAMAMMISGQVAETWFALLEQRASKALLARQVAQGEQLLELVELRFSVGQSNAVAVLQQRHQVPSLRAQQPLVEAAIATLGHQLAVLLGRAPGGDLGLKRDAALPKAPPLPATGVPAEILARRPDVRAAMLRVRGADHRVGVAIADRFPALRLTGRAGFQGRDGVENLFDNWIWNLAANLAAPLIDGGRRKAEVRRNQFGLQDALAAYTQKVIGAIAEVEDALVREKRQGEHISALERRLDLAGKALSEARNRYADGQGDYLSVLTALQSHQQAERALLGARRQLLSHRVALYRAMGGSWAGKKAASKPTPKPVPKSAAPAPAKTAAAAARTRLAALPASARTPK